jgi:hypothetical protein
MMFLLALAAKITVSITLTNDCSFFAFKASELRLLLNAWRFLLHASLLSLLMSQSDQVVQIGMMFINNLELLSNFDYMDCCSICCESKHEVGMRLYSFILPISKRLNTYPKLFWCVSLHSLPPLSVSNQRQHFTQPGVTCKSMHEVIDREAGGSTS